MTIMFYVCARMHPSQTLTRTHASIGGAPSHVCIHRRRTLACMQPWHAHMHACIHCTFTCMHHRHTHACIHPRRTCIHADTPMHAQGSHACIHADTAHACIHADTPMHA
jgi:hypothetical protein